MPCPSSQTRQCWIIQGDTQRSAELASAKLSGAAHILSFGPRHIPFTQATNYLGRECDYLLVDTRDGLPVDRFTAILGTLRGGGLLLLLVDDFATWPDQLDASRAAFAAYPFKTAQVGQGFLTRLCRYLDQAACVQKFTQQQFARKTLPMPSGGPIGGALTPHPTPEQQQVIAAVKRVALGHAKRPLVLTADRGRGKSTALGMALAEFLAGHPAKKIMILAPSRAAVQALFARLSATQETRVEFKLPQAYLRELPACDLLIVDEAAVIPLPVLRTILHAHNRLVFSSTVHGYEGSGRGFALRFAQILDQAMPQWKHLSMYQAIRWAADDPLERLINDSFLLNAELPDAPANPKYTLRWISQDALAKDENLLRQLFALLVTAHYQTRPSDLRQLLDAPDISIQIALAGDTLAGVLLAVREGGLDAQLAEAICAGQRRPRGHMLVQSLACHAGWCEAPKLNLLRIMRIAVHPACRRLGIGSAMLQAAKQRAQQNQADLLGAAFGLDAELLAFWQTAGLHAVRIGHRQDPASGARSVQMLLGLSPSGKQLCHAATARFQQALPWRFARQLHDLDADTAGRLMRGRNCADLPLGASDQTDLQACTNGQRTAEETWPVLWRWYCHVLAQGRQRVLPERQQTLLLNYTLQNKSAGAIQKALSIKGRTLFGKTLRETVETLLTAG